MEIDPPGYGGYTHGSIAPPLQFLWGNKYLCAPLKLVCFQETLASGFLLPLFLGCFLIADRQTPPKLLDKALAKLPHSQDTRGASETKRNDAVQ
jgi:hypothetical protein